jgi:integrase/recombinase XerC
MADYLSDFTESLRLEDKADNTIASYIRDLKHFACWFAQTNSEEFTLEGITPMDVKDYRRYLLVNAKAKPATVNRHLAALRRLCRWARGKGLIDDDPTEGVKGVEKERHLAPKSLNRNQVHALIRATQRYGNRRDVAIIQLLRNTGIRVSELANLRLSDLAISDRKGRIIVRWGKGGRYREIDLNADARQAISGYLEVRPNVADDHLFIDQRGTGLSARAIESLVTKYAGWAGLQGVTPHVLRHTFGKQLLDAGENLVTVATLMGHSRLDTTAIYTRPNAQDLGKALDKLAETE